MYSSRKTIVCSWVFRSNRHDHDALEAQCILGSDRIRRSGVCEGIPHGTAEYPRRDYRCQQTTGRYLALAFLGGAVLQRGRFAGWVDCLDPLLVILLVVFMIRMPIEVIKDNLWELMNVEYPISKSQRATSTFEIEYSILDILSFLKSTSQSYVRLT